MEIEEEILFIFQHQYILYIGAQIIGGALVYIWGTTLYFDTLFHDFAQSTTLRGLHIEHSILRFHLSCNHLNFLNTYFRFHYRIIYLNILKKLYYLRPGPILVVAGCIQEVSLRASYI